MRVEIHVTAGPLKGRRFIFDKPDYLLFGRTPDAQISLPNDRYVSRQHFVLEIAPPLCKLIDLNSKNGVFVNGIRYGGQKPPEAGVEQAPNGVKEVFLNDRDEIIVGDTHIKVVIPSERKKSEKTPGEAPVNQKVQSIREVSSSALSIRGYHIEQELKYDGIGTLYKAKDLNTDQFVAIKTLLLQGTIDPYQMNIFQRELNILRQLNHKHIVRFFGHGKTDDILYFIFEFVDSIDLAKFIRLKGGRISMREAFPILLNILDGLAYAHHAKITFQDIRGKRETFEGVVHRNLKPQNILLLRQGNSWIPKITDFGLSKSFESAGLTNITAPGDVVGTPIYWPREQLIHYRYLNPATDVFSIAAVFYEMVTGSWVREGFKELSDTSKRLGRLPGVSDYMDVITANPPIPIRQRNPNIPEPLAKVIDQALWEGEIPPDPNEMRELLKKLRYADAGAFRKALLNAIEAIEVSKSAIRSQARSHERSKDNTIWETTATRQPFSQDEVALFILDLVGSTQYILEQGDTNFSTVIGNIFRQIKTHSSSSELLFLKGMGDGFLGIFRSVSTAFSLASRLLETPIHPNIPIRMALHWGSVKIVPNKDVFGTEVHKILQIERIEIHDRLTSTKPEEVFPETNRILATKLAMERLHDSEKARFRPAGRFRLKGFKKPCELWVLHK